MSIKTRFIAPQIWGNVSDEIREAAEVALGGKKNCINRYASNILNDLTDRGEIALAGELEEELTENLRS